jgi:hypothetical protein
VPRLADLGLDATGSALIGLDRNLKTTSRGVFAIGSAAGGAFTYVANYQVRAISFARQNELQCGTVGRLCEAISAFLSPATDSRLRRIIRLVSPDGLNWSAMGE